MNLAEWHAARERSALRAAIFHDNRITTLEAVAARRAQFFAAVRNTFGGSR
jgi:hypothetical protein